MTRLILILCLAACTPVVRDYPHQEGGPRPVTDVCCDKGGFWEEILG